MNNNTTGGSRAKSTVFLNRKLITNKWNTLVLPFFIEEDVVSSVFGAGTIYAVLLGAYDKNNPTTIYFQRETDGIKAGRLYTIRPTNSQPQNQPAVSSSATNDDGTALITWGTEGSTDQTYWRFESVDFGKDNDESGNPQSYDEAAYSENHGKETYHEGNVYFKGTYINHGDELYIPPFSYVLSATNTSSGKAKEGEWYYRTKGTKTKGFRGWLQTVDPNAASARVNFMLNGEMWGTDGGSATDIDEFTVDGKKVIIVGDGVYNLQGQRVREGSSLEGLAKGVYIVNGKKVLVK